jgi:hypothetical protein
MLMSFLPVLLKQRFSEAMRERQQISANEVCIAVYGFPEEGHDKEQLQEMFDYLRRACCIVSLSKSWSFSQV